MIPSPTTARSLAATCVVACLALVPPSPVNAADAAGSFAADGMGLRKCADLTRAYDEKNDRYLAAFASWLDGFISASNILTPQTFDLTPWQTVELSLSKIAAYCQANPDLAFVEAAGRYVTTLTPARMTAASDVVQLRNGQQAVVFYRSGLTPLKQVLAAKGYPVAGSGDGFDAAFADAIAKYQAAAGLTVSGLPDQPTMNALFP